MSPLASLARRDAQSLRRDTFLLFLSSYGLLLALLLRWLAPLIPIPSPELYAAPAPILITSLLAGTVLGFGLIEEREQQTWLLLQVLPIPERSLLAYLVLSCSGIALLSSLIGALLYGHPVAQPLLFAGMVLTSALTAPLLMLLLGALASNKIEGLAVSKILGSVNLAAVLAFFIPPAWHWTLAWVPHYWLYLGLLHAYAGPDTFQTLTPLVPAYPVWLYLAAPLVLAIAGSAATLRLLRRRASHA